MDAASTLKLILSKGKGTWRAQALASSMLNLRGLPPCEVFPLRLKPFLEVSALSGRGSWPPDTGPLPAWRGLVPSPFRMPGRSPWIQGWLFLGPEMEGLLRRGGVPFQVAGSENHPFPLEPLLFREPLNELVLSDWLNSAWRARWWSDLAHPFLLEQEVLAEGEGQVGGALGSQLFRRPAICQETTEDGGLAEASDAVPPSLWAVWEASLRGEGEEEP